MKFKPNAATRTLYKLLGLFSSILYIYAALSFVLGFIVGLEASNSENGASTLGTAVGFVLGGLVFAVIGERLRIIKQEMVTRSDDEV